MRREQRRGGRSAFKTRGPRSVHAARQGHQHLVLLETRCAINVGIGHHSSGVRMTDSVVHDETLLGSVTEWQIAIGHDEKRLRGRVLGAGLK